MEEDLSLGTVLSVKECKTLRSLAVADVGKKMELEESWFVLISIGLCKQVYTEFVVA